MHGRKEVPAWVLTEGPTLLARLLYHLELKGFYEHKEVKERYTFLKETPPSPAQQPQPIEPARARAPFERAAGAPRPPVPNRCFHLRALFLPRRPLR